MQITPIQNSNTTFGSRFKNNNFYLHTVLGDMRRAYTELKKPYEMNDYDIAQLRKIREFCETFMDNRTPRKPGTDHVHCSSFKYWIDAFLREPLKRSLNECKEHLPWFDALLRDGKDRVIEFSMVKLDKIDEWNHTSHAIKATVNGKAFGKLYLNDTINDYHGRSAIFKHLAAMGKEFKLEKRMEINDDNFLTKLDEISNKVLARNDGAY